MYAKHLQMFFSSSSQAPDSYILLPPECLHLDERFKLNMPQINSSWLPPPPPTCASYLGMEAQIHTAVLASGVATNWGIPLTDPFPSPPIFQSSTELCWVYLSNLKYNLSLHLCCPCLGNTGHSPVSSQPVLSSIQPQEFYI